MQTIYTLILVLTIKTKQNICQFIAKKKKLEYANCTYDLGALGENEIIAEVMYTFTDDHRLIKLYIS